jgi:hypothetical protein
MSIETERTGAKPLRVFLDDCVGSESRLVNLFRKTLAPDILVDYIRLAKVHKAIPDCEILGRLLGSETVLLTHDRVLHNQACQLGFRSYTLNERGDIVRKKLAGVRAPAPVAARGAGDLKTDYTHAANPITTALKQGMDERALERYRTRRRRIRSYFGSESHISQVAITIGGVDTKAGVICGFFLAAAGYSGMKGIRASEGYGLGIEHQWEPALCLLHALKDLYLLNLESVTVELFVIPHDSLSVCQQILAVPAVLRASDATKALEILLRGLASVRVVPCVKGFFFNAMNRKLEQMARGRTNELVLVDFKHIVSVINSAPVDSDILIPPHEQIQKWNCTETEIKAKAVDGSPSPPGRELG